MRLHVLYQGLPAKFSQDFLSWPTCAFVESCGRKIMFDTGFATQRERLPRLLEERTGCTVEDIDYVVLSHLHYDHAYNFDLFPNARILAHAQEVAHALGGANTDFAYHGFLSEGIASTGVLEVVEEGYEVAPGVTTLFVPGHTPGSLALLLSGEDMPDTVLAGDAVKNMGELASGTTPWAMMPEKATASIRRIRDLAEVVVPGHDRMLRVLPERIEAVGASELTLVYAEGCTPEGAPAQIALGLGISSQPITE